MVAQKIKDPIMSSILKISYTNVTVSLMNRLSLANFYLVEKEGKTTYQSIIKGICVQCIIVAPLIKIALDVNNIKKHTYSYIWAI